MNSQTICILFSILLVPVNLLCTHWMTQEAVHLTGMTYMEFLKTTSGISASSVRRKRNWWYYVHFFNEYSANPEKSICFMRMHVAAVLPSVAAMYLLARVYASPDRVSSSMTGNCILLAVNLVLAAGGALYRRIHPLDPLRRRSSGKSTRRSGHTAGRTWEKRRLVPPCRWASFWRSCISLEAARPPAGRRRRTRCILRRFCRKGVRNGGRIPDLWAGSTGTSSPGPSPGQRAAVGGMLSLRRR